MQGEKAMSEEEQPDLISRAHRIDFAAAVRREHEQALRRQVSVRAMPCVYQQLESKTPAMFLGNTAGVSCTHTRTGRPGAGGSGT